MRIMLMLFFKNDKVSIPHDTLCRKNDRFLKLLCQLLWITTTITISRQTLRLASVAFARARAFASRSVSLLRIYINRYSLSFSLFSLFLFLFLSLQRTQAPRFQPDASMPQEELAPPFEKLKFAFILFENATRVKLPINFVFKYKRFFNSRIRFFFIFLFIIYHPR